MFGLNDQALTPFLIHRDNREGVLKWLESSPLPSVQALLASRSVTNTVLFSPSRSAAGQAFDTAVSICGLLLNSGNLSEGMADHISTAARSAVRGEGSRQLEAILMDELSLGERFNWRQIVAFNNHIQDPQTLGILTDAARNAGRRWSVLFDALQVSQQPGLVARYLLNYNSTGLSDLEVAEQYGPRALNELLERGERLYSSPLQERAATGPFAGYYHGMAGFALANPTGAMAVKWLLFLTGGFFAALAGRGFWAWAVERPAPLSFRAQVARDVLFASGVLLVALLLSEPFLALSSQKGELPFRVRLPGVGGAIASQVTRVKQSTMNTQNTTASLLTLLLFFILQALIYMACLSRLHETLRQNVSARVKLKLLENEEHLFDAGLYLGFVGTIICLILVSLGVLQFSLMAAYSSTSFGIIFVSILKIFKVRPARRRLLLEAEVENAADPVNTPAPTFATVP